MDIHELPLRNNVVYRMEISGFAQWYPFGIQTAHPLLHPHLAPYQYADENILYRFELREQQ